MVQLTTASLGLDLRPVSKRVQTELLASMWPKSSITMLLALSQNDDESLSQFIAHFANEIQRVPNAYPSLIMQAFLMGL